ncbi:apolipoprotein N-acyltransferase [uncultured Nonlabens sp.]|uniref:apolipoprotein N-acyltransferase n=1 Tax=uncultured Nonlabens sp. TaxID=859306 RepID=UPI00260FB138|nr:apolipoprotein N-acyltransferase [uncultured Nonlabens sp.]
MKITSILLAILSGILLWLGWPTYGFAGLLFIALVPLLISERKLRLSDSKNIAGKVFLHSYLTFFIWNIATTYWLYFSTPFGMWFAVLVNTALMSLVFLGYHYLARKATQGAALTFLACLWISFERLHLDWDFSWPWLNLGNGFSETTSWIQWYEYTGTFGGSLWIWLVNIFIFVAVLRFRESGLTTRRKFIIKRSLVLTAIIAIPVLISQALIIESIPFQKDGGTNVVIVQPNIDPYEEKYYLNNDSIIKTIMSLAKPEMDQFTDLIITPETVLADDVRLNNLTQLKFNPTVLSIRQELYDYPNVNYLGGVAIDEVFTDKRRATGRTNLFRDGRTFYNSYNSAMFLSAGGPLGLYNKSKLVVGVENFPYKGILQPILGDVMLDLGGTVSTKTIQEDRTVFKTIDATVVAPVICYESVYGEYVTEFVKNGAQVLAIITNDAWWNETQGHKQHLSLARLRAIENRRWIARSANTGISAIIDDRGVIKKSLGYEKQGVLKGTLLPKTELTFYTIHGDYIARIATVMGLFVLLFSIFRRGKMQRK